MTKGFLEELDSRGLLYQQTADSELELHLASGSRVGYCGFDPTADSLTVGNLVAIKLLGLWQRAGHKPLVVMGGATGLIGDPSGKDKERPLITRDMVEENIKGQLRVFERFLDFDEKNPVKAEILNNADWLSGLSFVDALRDVGKHFSVNSMIQRDSVKTRLEERAQGISYTEFSYVLLQAYDFLELRRSRQCTVQMAGSDQYGNIVAGIDLVRRVLGSEGQGCFGVTAPLLTHSDGRKIGKSEGSALWLTRERTSPFTFYQYWINVSDEEVGNFLNWFTYFSKNEILDILEVHKKNPGKRHAQRNLAQHMTDLLYGSGERSQIELASETLFGGGDPRAIPEDILGQVVSDLPHTEHSLDFASSRLPLLDLLPETSLASSKREAREFLKNGAIWVNGRKALLADNITVSDLLPGRALLLRRGKKKWHASTFKKR